MRTKTAVQKEKQYLMPLPFPLIDYRVEIVSVPVEIISLPDATKTKTLTGKI